MKKILSIIIIMIMSLSLFACKDGNDNVSDNGEIEETKEKDTTKEKETTSKVESTKPQYISNRSVDYDDANEKHRVFWAFSATEKGSYIKADATIHITITNDDGKEVFNKSYDVDDSYYSEWTNSYWDSDRLLGCIYIYDNEFVGGTTDNGKLSISASLEDGTYWEEHIENVYYLPIMGFSMNMPALPYVVHELDYDDEIERTIEVLELKTEYSNGSVKANLKVKMTYNEEGNNSSDYAYVGYKVKDEEGVVIGSGSILVGPLAVGDIMINSGYLEGDYELGKTYTIELINAD